MVARGDRLICFSTNECEYSYANHWKNAAYLIGDKSRADSIEDALKGVVLKMCLTEQNWPFCNMRKH